MPACVPTLMRPVRVVLNETAMLNAASVAVLWFGGIRVDAGAMEIGSLTAFLAYLVQILMSVMMATFMAIMVPRASVCAERIKEVLDTPSTVVAPARVHPPVGRGLELLHGLGPIVLLERDGGPRGVDQSGDLAVGVADLGRA